MEILKVEKGKAQIELTEKDIETIERGLGWGHNETFSEELPYAQLQEEFQKALK